MEQKEQKNVLESRYQFVLLFDVEDGNPNGDPDAGNAPRMDYETGTGRVTDVCIKRKVRNYVDLVAREKYEGVRGGLDIYYRERSVLNKTKEMTVANKNEEELALSKTDMERANQMCLARHFFDIRAFGAVLNTDKTSDNKGGQLKGPVVIHFAKSVDPISPVEHTITCVSRANEKENGQTQGMGTKHTIPYGLYIVRGEINPYYAEKTGFSEEDKDLFFESLINMFEYDRSASRGLITSQKLYVFKHDRKTLNAPAQKIYDLISCVKKEGVEFPRSIKDYNISIQGEIPAGIELIEML